MSTPSPGLLLRLGRGRRAYYGGTNTQGTQTAIVPTDPGLESPGTPSGSVAVAPSGTGWSFAGNSGILSDATKVSPGSSVVSGHAPGDPA